MSNRHPNPSSVGADAQLARFADEAREVERLKHLAIDLDDLDRMQDETRLEEIGIHNRAAARRAGLRSRKKQRSYAVPKTRKRRRRRR